MRMGEAKPHGFGLYRRLAHRRNIKGDIILSGATSTIVQLETLYSPYIRLTTQQPLRFLGKCICRHPNGDITISLERSYYYNMLKQMDLDADNINPVSAPSLRRPLAQQDTPLDPERHHIYCKVVGMLIWASLVHPDLQFSAKDHTRHLTSPSEWNWSHLKHTLRYIKGTMHYKFLISPRLPQGHSLPLRHLIPFTSIRTVTQTGLQTSSHGSPHQAQSRQYLEYLLRSTAGHNPQSQHHQQKPNSMPSASASATACTSTSYFKNFNNICRKKTLTSGISRLSTTSTTPSAHHHLSPHPNH